MTAARDWQTAAACRDVDDPDLFFPDKDFGPEYEAQVIAAKAVCAGCRVLIQCRAFAMESLGYGIAGGLSQDERWRLAGGKAPRRAVITLPGSTRAEIAATGRDLLAAGRSPAFVARECGVSQRTALRWAAQMKGAA